MLLLLLSSRPGDSGAGAILWLRAGHAFSQIPNKMPRLVSALEARREEQNREQFFKPRALKN